MYGRLLALGGGLASSTAPGNRPRRRSGRWRSTSSSGRVGLATGLDGLSDKGRREVLELLLDGATIDRHNNVNLTLGIPTEDVVSIAEQEPTIAFTVRNDRPSGPPIEIEMLTVPNDLSALASVRPRGHTVPRKPAGGVFEGAGSPVIE